MTSVIRRRDIHRGKRPQEDTHRDESYAATGQGMPGDTGRWKRQGSFLS